MERVAFAEAPSLAVFGSHFHKNKRASLPHNTLEGSCGILKHKLYMYYYNELMRSCEIVTVIVL